MDTNKSNVAAAIKRAGSVWALAGALRWDPSAIERVADGGKISPFRAGTVADFLGLNRAQRDSAIRQALYNLSASDAEAHYWTSLRLEDALVPQARALALKVWFAAGDDDLKLFEDLECATLAALKKNA